MNELDLIKLNIFEAYDNGEISYGEKEYLLEQVDYMYEAGKPLPKAAKIGLGVAAIPAAAGIGYGLYKGSKALNKSIQNRNLKKKYDKTVDDLLKTKSELETQLISTKNPMQKLNIKKQIKAIEKQIKVLENESDNQLNKEVNESTFDYLSNMLQVYEAYDLPEYLEYTYDDYIQDKLNINEAYDNGEISYGEKKYLLEKVECMYEAGRGKSFGGKWDKNRPMSQSNRDAYLTSNAMNNRAKEAAKAKYQELLAQGKETEANEYKKMFKL